MAVNYDKTARSKSEIEDEEDLYFTLLYSLPFDNYQKGGFWKRQMLGTSGGFETVDKEYEAIIAPFDGAFELGSFRHCILDMSPFELVNEHQWSGVEPIEIRQWNANSGFQKIDNERPLWVISGFNAARGSRIIAGYSHANKDSVFTVQYRLNVMIDYVRGLIKPYENEVRDNFKAERTEPEGTPDTHPEQHEMMAELLSAYRENKPHWEF